jgi:hypothetical protein
MMEILQLIHIYNQILDRKKKAHRNKYRERERERERERVGTLGLEMKQWVGC